MGEREVGDSKAGITRRRFLEVAAVTLAGAIGGIGCEPAGEVRKAHPPRPEGGAWAFRSRPDLRPPAVGVARRGNGTAPGYTFVAPKNGPE